MNGLKSKYWLHLITALLAVGVFCFWLFLFPFVPVVREMAQLFLWTSDYFVERIVLPGGLAQYLGEMTGQLFLNPVNAAIVYALIFIIARQLSSRWLRLAFPKQKAAYRFLLSLLMLIVLWSLAMLPRIPLTVTMAILLVMGAGGVLMAVPRKNRFWALLPTIPVMYWLTGPMAVLLTLCCIRWIPVTATLFAVCLIGSSWLTPYPLRQIVRGIDYKWSDVRQMGTYEEMECDMLIRQQQWGKILKKFPSPESPAVRNACILALYQTGGISYNELMSRTVVPIEMYESSPSVFCAGDSYGIVYFGSLSSAFIVSEIAYRLLWTGISQRTAFEAMEYIPNYNKSGRALKILTEISIITGQYTLAEKYLSILDETTFYRRWVRKMRPMLANPKLIEQDTFMKRSRDSYLKTKDYFFI